MARIRTFKPEVFTDAKTQRLSYPAFILWMGIWNQADDKTGCFDARPEILRGQVFPLRKEETEETIAGYLREMAKQRLIALYLDGDQPLGQVNGWKHQRIEKPSKLVRFRTPEECGGSIPVALPEYSRNTPVVLPEPSSSPPVALPVGSGSGSGFGSGSGTRIDSVPAGTVDPPSKDPPDPEETEPQREAVRTVWSHYLTVWPRQAKLTSDRRNKIKARLKDSTLEEILRAITQSKWDDWPEREKNSDLELLIRTRAKMERHLLRKPPKKHNPGYTGANWDDDPVEEEETNAG